MKEILKKGMISEKITLHITEVFGIAVLWYYVLRVDDPVILPAFITIMMLVIGYTRTKIEDKNE